MVEKIIFEPRDLARLFKKADCRDPYLEIPPDQFEGSVDGPLTRLNDQPAIPSAAGRQGGGAPGTAQGESGFWSRLLFWR